MTHFLRYPLAALFAVLITLGHPAIAQQGPVKIGIISAMDDELLDAFYDEVAKYNPKVLAKARPASDKEADAMVYFLQSWEEATRAPGLSDNTLLQDEIAGLPEGTARHDITLTFENGRKLPLILYSVEAVGDIPLTCYAQDIARVLKGNAAALEDSVCDL